MQDNNPFFCPFSASQQELVATDCLWFMRSSQIEFSLYVLILHPEPYSQVNGKWQIGKQATCADEITFIPPSTTKLNISPVTGPKNFMDPVPLNRNSKGNTNPRRSRVDCGSSLLEHFHSFQKKKKQLCSMLSLS
ncbi:uncharacterized protein LOC120092055 isoform X3 [Benincasa hispida]|uniref:uncharacterized protein LOC120092055 isoform X3 n=1 Tax=Benincasa hispida TaxID=102211 RepID=UPI00190269F2|nr:uncharacterized protein LOC120092055 isoform X3 [Benincasa hispida]